MLYVPRREVTLDTSLPHPMHVRKKSPEWPKNPSHGPGASFAVLIPSLIPHCSPYPTRYP